MSTLIIEEGLKKLISEGVIEKGEEDCVEGIKYDFRLSNRFLKAKHQGPAKISDFTIATKENFSVEPGETVFVLSEEILHLPKDIKAELSHKRKLAHLGILVLGGFCIDPLYEGHLIFGMYNYSNRTFQLKVERKLIAAQFYRLSEEETAEFTKPQSLMDFPDELIQIAIGLRPISLQGLEQKINEISERFLKIEDDFQKRDKWFNDIQKNIDKLMDATTKLNSLLEVEVAARKTGQDTLQDLINKEQIIIKELAGSVTTEKLIRKIAIWIIAAIMAVGLAIGIANITKLPFFESAKQSTKVETPK